MRNGNRKVPDGIAIGDFLIEKGRTGQTEMVARSAFSLPPLPCENHEDCPGGDKASHKNHKKCFVHNGSSAGQLNVNSVKQEAPEGCADDAAQDQTGGYHPMVNPGRLSFQPPAGRQQESGQDEKADRADSYRAVPPSRAAPSFRTAAGFHFIFSG